MKDAGDLIKVTKKHIKEGERNDLAFCAIGLALQEYGFSKFDIEIYPDMITLGCYIYKCPKPLRRFQEQGLNEVVNDINAPKKQKPFKFRLSDLRPA